MNLSGLDLSVLKAKMRPMTFTVRFLIVGLCCSAQIALASSAPPADLLRDRAAVQRALENKNPKLAADLLRPWLEKRPQDSSIANDYALALAQLGQLDAAREALEKGLESDPDTAVLFANLREVLSQQAAVSYAKAMGRQTPENVVRLKASSQFRVPATVVAQASPRSEAKVEAVSPAVRAGGGQANAPDLAAMLASPIAPVPVAGQSSPLSDQIIAATQAWAKDWSSRNFSNYLSHYSADFKSQQFASRQDWESYRRPRVDRADPIAVEVSQFKVRPLAGDKAEVTFRQRFDSRNLKLNTVRKVLWKREADGWKIIQEDNR